MDLGIEVILKLFTASSFETLFDFAYDNERLYTDNDYRIFALREEYLKTIDSVINFLQGKQPTLARQICTSNFLPKASRFDQLDDLDFAFGMMGMQDKAKHLATLYLEDLSDFITSCIDENFGFSRYAERIGRSANQFDGLYSCLKESPTYIDKLSIEILDQTIEKHQPKLVCFSVPFPGNLYSAFRCAKHIKSKHSHIKISLGGGFPNTELRSVSDTRVFDFFDYITLDDGELPLELIHYNLTHNPKVDFFKRTFLLENDQVIYRNDSLRSDYKMTQVGTPDYSDLLLKDYISVIELTNPMHSVWSDGRWNKLTMAHGCYWGKCTFCDISLDYIKNYDPVQATVLVDRMEEMIRQTGETGFHFVDEAAPPSLMGALALEILKRDLVVTWWTNIRFEKKFTFDLCRLLKASGCIAVSGGLEVASDRLLKLIDKGVTVEQVTRVTDHFTRAGIMVHAYLMYGYPTQTVQETIDSLEMVRQLFEAEVLQSGFWHQFALTAHSPIGQNPEAYGILPKRETITFADNDIAFEDTTGINHNQFSDGLKKSLFNYMHGVGFDLDLQEWFDFPIPPTVIAPSLIEIYLETGVNPKVKPQQKVIWLGTMPYVQELDQITQLTFHNKTKTFQLDIDSTLASWLIELLDSCSYNAESQLTVKELKKSYESYFNDFDTFLESQIILTLREFGLLIV